MNKISLLDIKQALLDGRFRDGLPLALKPEIAQYLQNPSCPCNLPLYRKILKDHKDYLIKYFPSKTISDEDDEIRKLSENHWTVINCHIDELESHLKKLSPGRKQIDVARWQDQATVVVNELDILY